MHLSLDAKLVEFVLKIKPGKSIVCLNKLGPGLQIVFLDKPEFSFWTTSILATVINKEVIETDISF